MKMLEAQEEAFPMILLSNEKPYTGESDDTRI
jgi:hypothetical protein